MQTTEYNEFINIEVKLSALKRILQKHNLHICDIHCKNTQDKIKLQKLLLQTLSSK